MGAQMWWDDNRDDENDRGEEWMENPLIYNKLLSWSWNWETIKYY